MNIPSLALAISDEVKKTLRDIDPASSGALPEEILKARRIFLAGVGRSGLMLKAAGMRLMHLGLTVYIAGETVTPGIRQGDLLLIGSGSGETPSLVSMAQKAKSVGASLSLITILPSSSIAQLADPVVCIPAPTSKSEDTKQYHSIQPMGSLFEQCLFLFLDALVLDLMDRLKLDSDQMFRLHANLE